MSSTRTRSLSLYRQLLRAGGGFSNYNFREYALRRVRTGFRENLGVSAEPQVIDLVRQGERQLELVRRQAMISQLYPQPRHVLEGITPKEARVA
mmetsp:Transcript_18207/g.48984  ORF Transcript_18207/g.48984 Transcript_18207/m.48984 type:complete len:94 (-) Transcript_18207:571-852(-)